MKKLMAIAMAVVLLLVMGLGAIAPAPATAQEGWGGKNAITVDITWNEKYTAHRPDGTLEFEWGPYPVGPVEFKKNPQSETYRTTDMEAFMEGPSITNLEGFIMVNRPGKLHGELTYISRGRTIYQEFWGQVIVTMADGNTATMSGEYHDRIYVQQPDGTLVLARYGDYEVTP